MSTSEQLEFARSIEGTFIKALGPDLTPELKARLRSEGLDLDRPLLPAYSPEDYHRWIKVAAQELYVYDSSTEACRKLGFRSVAGLEDTMMGKALAAGLKLIGPMRSLQRIDRLVRHNNNYMLATVSDLNISGGRVHLSHVYGVPSYYAGFFEAAVKVSGGRNPRVTTLPAPPPGALYQLEWTA
ncbi:MAG: DUF2378 family protein [Myxococcaceae bacterium]